MLNIVIPMAGAGSRFAKEGYKDPKPMIPVHGKPMIQAVVDNLTPRMPHRFTFICQEQHVRDYKLDNLLNSITEEPNIICINGVTEGAAVTVLKSEHIINNSDPLVIANCDQWVDADMTSFVNQLLECDGNVMTMTANDPKWSFVQFDGNYKPIAIIEKKVVSDVATVGIYGYRRGEDFVKAAQEMIANNLRVNNEFYVAPTYTPLFEKGLDIRLFHIEGMYGIGTPEDLQSFISNPVSLRA